jgi:hypothetical protein
MLICNSLAVFKSYSLSSQPEKKKWVVHIICYTQVILSLWQISLERFLSRWQGACITACDRTVLNKLFRMNQKRVRRFGRYRGSYISFALELSKEGGLNLVLHIVTRQRSSKCILCQMSLAVFSSARLPLTAWLSKHGGDSLPAPIIENLRYAAMPPAQSENKENNYSCNMHLSR